MRHAEIDCVFGEKVVKVMPLDCKLLPEKGYETLERYDWKLSRTVLRRGRASNRPSLFGKGNFHVPFLEEGGRVIALLYSAVKTVLKKEFRESALKHNHVVSPEYYLELKLEESRQNFFSRDKK